MGTPPMDSEDISTTFGGVHGNSSDVKMEEF
jgi:hypothetical protein